MEDSLRANIDNEMEHLEFCYFTMVRMMQQLGEDGNIGAMLKHYLAADNNFDKFQRRRDLENAMLSAASVNTYVNFSIYMDSDTKEELFGSGAFDGRAAAGEECVTQIGENRFQVLHRSNSKYNDSVVASMLREKQHFRDRTLDIYIEMKSNIKDYAARGACPFSPCSWMRKGRCFFPTVNTLRRGKYWSLRFRRTAASRDGSGIITSWRKSRRWAFST